MQPPRCCICRSRAKKRTHPTTKYESDILKCFGVRVNERVAVDENSRICHSCHGCIMKYRSDGTLRPDRVDSQGQQGYHGHQQIGGKRKPTTNPEPELTTSSQPSTVNAAVGTNDEIGADGVAAKKLARLMDCSPETSYLTRDQEILFHQMATKVVNTQASGKHVKNFTTRPARGPGLNLFCAPKARVSSSNCSRQTLANRSEAIEEFQSLLACDATSTPEERTTAVTEQRATMFKRDREGYAKALEKAGFKTLGKFTRETVLDLRSRMPMESWQYVKRVLLKELGINLMGTERQLKEEIKALQFEYECISFNDANTGKPIHAIRAANVNDVITRTLELLQERNQLELLDNNDDDTLWIHISGDKGGKATKLLLQVVNASNRHSIKSAKMLGMFEGGKDSRENIELAFKPIFDQIQELAKDFHLDVNRPTQLQSPTPEPMSASEIQDHMTNTLQPLDTSNRTHSSDCQYCCQSCPSSSEKSYAYNGAKYKKLRVTFGGDWEWLARLLGLSGPNGRQFCLHCLCPRADLKKGSSYGLHELNNGSDDQIQADDDDSSGASTLRTYEGCRASNALFTAAGGVNAAEYNNCIHEPLNWDTGPIIDTVSVTPLHISLGLGLQNVNAIENMAIALDAEVKAADGLTSDALTELITSRGTLLEHIQSLAEDEGDLDRQIGECAEQEDELKRLNPEHFRRENRALVDTSREAIASRGRLKTIRQEKNSHQKDLKTCKKALDETQAQLEGVLSKIAKESGPFKARFDKTMNELKLKRVVYHSGALIGPDVHKVLQPASIECFGKIFEEVEVDTKNGMQAFGSDVMVSKVTGLLTKFAECYKLYTKNAPLCCHEVEQLCSACMEYGTWFPINFPEESIKPKFHMLTVELPRQVRRMRTIGMLTEQVSESIHPYVNKLERMFASTRDIPARQMLTMRQHNILSGLK